MLDPRFLMQGKNKEHWEELCAQAAVEQDGQKLLELVKQPWRTNYFVIRRYPRGTVSRNPRGLPTSRLFTMQLGFGFLMQIVLSAAFLAVGLLILCWPGTYLRWVHWSKVGGYAPWLVRGWDVNHPPYPWRVRILGVPFVLFGITAVVLSIWIRWFQ